MPRHLHVLVALFVVGIVSTASAQPRQTGPRSSPRASAASGGSLSGIVSSDDGAAIGGVSVLAMGTVLAVATSDAAGRFTMRLPTGDYVIRAAREGYVSTYREPLNVRTNAMLERNITLVRAENPEAQPSEGASSGSTTDGSAHGHGDAAWRLRHLPRSVLRDVAHVGRPSGGGEWPPGTPPRIDWARRTAGRDTTSFLANMDFSGQVNLLTTGSLASVPSRWPEEWLRGLAYVSLGAPLGRLGEWTARAGMTGGDLSSWTFAGDYRAHERLAHALQLGVSYSSQTFAVAPAALGSVPEARAVGSLSAFDVWRVSPLLALDYGVRLEHYDYLREPLLASPSAGATVRLFDRVRMRAATGERQVAPGAEQFLPPSTSGPWLPPERTFSPLRAGGRLRAENVRRYSVGAQVDLDRDARRTMSVDRFAQSTSGQFATLFGINSASEVGHYYVSPVGHVFVEGWRLGIEGQLFEQVQGFISYTAASADWTRSTSVWTLWQVAPSAVRRRHERAHDLTTALEIAVPDTSTHVSLAYRLSSAFVSARAAAARPAVDDRFRFELRQTLPFQPLQSSELNVLFSLRTLLRDFDESGSFYDELLTVKPPLRITGGLQVRF